MIRARDPEQKAQRRETILQAAAQLFLENGHQLPSAAQVAKKANVAKGTVYLYFKTKEEIFLSLFSHKIGQLIQSFEQLNTQSAIDTQLVTLVLEFGQREPSFMPLSTVLQSVLDTKIPPGTLYQFKKELSEALANAGKSLDMSFELPDGFSERALLHSYGGLVGLWQLLQWPEVLSDVKDEPVFAPLQRDLAKELSILFRNIWQQH